MVLFSILRMKKKAEASEVFVVSLHYSIFAESSECCCFLLLLVFYFLCISQFDFKGLKVEVIHPSLHVYRNIPPNSNIWLSVF